MKQMRFVVFSILFFLSSFNSASAATFFWAGANGANWNDVNNWSSTASPITRVTSLPTSADVVRVSENSVTIPTGFDAIANYIVVNTNNEAKPAQIIVQQGSSLTSAANNTGSGACIYLRGGAIINNGTITLQVTNTPSGYGMSFENATDASIKTASTYSGDGVLIINAIGQTTGGAIKFLQTVTNPVFTVNNKNNYQFNLATGRWLITVMSGSNAIINGTGSIDLGSSLAPSVYGLFNFTATNTALTVESGVTLNANCNGYFGMENGLINIGNFSGIKFTNKGIINMHTNGSNGIYCGSSSTANAIIITGILTIDGGSAIIFGGNGSASITNTGTLSAINVPSNSYSAGVYTGAVGPFIVKSSSPGILNLASGLGISPQISTDFPVVILIDSQTAANTRPFLIDNLLPSYSQSQNWDVVFSDEFNDTKMDVTKWSIDNKTFNQPTITIYSDENQVEEKDGNIYLYYRKSPTDPTKYYVGRFFSKQKYTTAYGYFECRMHVVRPEGYQSAFWMVPEGGLTPNGVIDGTAHDGAEIDIFEGVQNGDKYWTGLHYDGYGDFHQNVGKEITAPGLHSEEYHIFGFEWAPSFLKYYYDGKVVRTVTDPKLIPEVPHFLYLSGAIWSEIGWSEMSVLDNVFLNSGGVDKAYFDYVRIFKNKATYPPLNLLPENFTENTIVMDNADATGVTIVGDWGTSVNSTPFYKSNYMLDNNSGKGSKSVHFTPVLKTTGKYEIFTHYPSETNRSNTTKYIIKRADGDTTVLVDQTKNGGVWLLLGKYNLLNDNSPKVIISNANTSGYVIVDAVAFNPIANNNTAVNDLMQMKDEVSVFSNNGEIIVRLNQQPTGSVTIDIYNANGILVNTHTNTDMNRKCKTFRLKNYSDVITAMYFVKVSIDGKSVCKKVIPTVHIK